FKISGIVCISRIYIEADLYAQSIRGWLLDQLLCFYKTVIAVYEALCRPARGTVVPFKKCSYDRQDALRRSVIIYKPSVLSLLIKVIICYFVIDHIQPIEPFQIVMGRIYSLLVCLLILKDI